MKVLPFTLLVPDDRSVISEHIELPYFYQYLHRHDEWQITYIEHGEGILISGSDMHSFKSGDIFLIGAKLPHLFKSNPDYFDSNSKKSITAYSVFFDSSDTLAPLFSLPEMKTANAFLVKNRHGFKVPYSSTNLVVKRMIAVHEASGGGVLFSFVELMATLQALGDNVIPLCSDLYSTKVTEYEGMRLSNIISFITQNFSSQITLKDVANIAFISPQAFCRYFKKHTGHTFVSFLNEVRISDACKNLTSGETSNCISGVAMRAGFNSITNFNRVFKIITGQSPSEYLELYNSVSRIRYVGD